MANVSATSSKTVLTTPLGTQPLVCRMKTFDALSQPFRYELDVVTAERKIDPGALLGKTITLSLRGEAGSVRHFHGHVVEVSERNNQREVGTSRPVYRWVLRPWLSLLGLRTSCRVFRDMSVVDIVKAVCAEHGFADRIEDALTQRYPQCEYCVQYNESDLAFVSRLLEREGIYYYFAHTESEHRLVLVDDPEHHQLRPENTDLPDRLQAPLNRHIDTWNETNHLRPSACGLDDYDFLMPTKRIEVKLQTEEPYSYGKGTQFEYPGGYTEPEVGQSYVKYRLHAQNAGASHVNGTANALGLSSGSTFTTLWSSGEYLVVRAESDLWFGDFETTGPMPERQPFDTTVAVLECAFTAVAKKTPFRPERLTPRPVIAGVQTARVVSADPAAPEGSIHTDEFGRVMVEFPWTDRTGESTAGAVQHSCWIRVAQTWAGNAWGMQFIPRVGSEVVVSFQDGNPDRPLVVGSVYNGLSRAPFPLPDGTVSGLKTDRALDGAGSDAEPNQLKFDDAKGKISMKGQQIGVAAKDAVGIEGASVAISGGASKVEVGGILESIALFCPNSLTLQTPVGKIELGPKGIAITGKLTVNELPYPVPSTPVALGLAIPKLLAEAAKIMATDAAMSAVAE
jgi:type VI secretion system secreted protein VgrG